jgi:hypothetical protein
VQRPIAEIAEFLCRDVEEVEAKSTSAGIDRAPRRSPVVRFAFTGTNVLKSNAGRILIPGGEGPVRCRLPGRLAS